MTPVRLFVPVKTPNPLNASGGGGNTQGARMAMQSLARLQRRLGYEQTISCLRGAGLPTRAVWIPAKVRKGVEVRPGFAREVVAEDAARWDVQLLRVGKGLLDDHDGLGPALKHVVDGIADALGVNDGDRRRVVWRYDQRREQERTGVEVEIGQQPAADFATERQRAEAEFLARMNRELVETLPWNEDKEKNG